MLLAETLAEFAQELQRLLQAQKPELARSFELPHGVLDLTARAVAILPLRDFHEVSRAAGPKGQGRKNYGRNHSQLHLLPCGADSFDKSSIFGLIAQVFEGRVTREIQQVVLTLIERCLQVLKGVLLFA